MRRLVLLALPLVMSLSACAADSEPAMIAENHAEIAGGQPDPDHTSVVGIARLAGGGFGMCTGTLIAPNLVLTAQHCVASTPGDYVQCGQTGFGAPSAGSELYVTLKQVTGFAAGDWIQAQKVDVPPGGSDLCGFDQALITLSQNIDSVPWMIPRIDLPVRNGEVYTAVGYGNTNDTSGSGQRRVREGLIVEFGTANAPVQYSGFIRASEWLGETGICSGDSGGPALDPDEKVIGVVSRGGQGCSSPVYGALTSHAEWIRDVGAEAAVLGGYEPPFWVTTGKSDDPNPPGAGGAGGAGGSGTGGAAGGPGIDVPAGGSSSSGSVQGDACSAGNLCSGDFVCAYQTTIDDAICAESCQSDADCSGELVCDLGLQGCFAQASGQGADSGSDSSCALVPGEGSQDPVQPVPWVVGLGLLGFALRRRARRF